VLNTRKLPSLAKEEEALIFANIDYLTKHLPQPHAALAIVAVLWAQAAWQVNKGGGFPPVKWAQTASLQLGVEITPDLALRVMSDLSPLAPGLPEKIGAVFDHIAPTLFQDGRGRQGKRQKREGFFVTPYRIARTMVERALDCADGEIGGILDPGTGTGVFLSAALHALVERGYSPHEALVRLYGVERNPVLAKMAEWLLSLEAGMDPEEVLSGGGARIWTEDFLMPGPNGVVDAHGPYTVIVMNPPYERVAKVDGADPEDKRVSAAYADRIRSSGAYPLTAAGPLEAYRLFIERALRLLSSDGVMSFVVPSTILADRAATLLRRELLTTTQVESIDLYPERARLFRGATQEVVIITLSKKTPKIEDKRTRIKLLKEGREVSQIPHEEVRGLTPGWVVPLLTEPQMRLFKELSAFPRLGDVPGVKVLRGELDQSLDAELIGAGEARFLRGKHIHRFRAAEGERCDLARLIEKRRGSFKVEHVALPRLAGRQVSNQGSGERLVFAYVEPPAVLGNSLNYVLLDEDKAPAGTTLWTLLGVLNSRVLDWYFRAINSNNHVGIYELKELPVPVTADVEALSEIGCLARELTACGGRNPELRNRLDAVVARAFGLEPESVIPLIAEKIPRR